MKIDFKKLIIGVLVFSVLLVAFSLVYYYVYFLPQKEYMQLKYEEEKEIKRLELETKQIELERQKQEQLEKQLEEDRKERERVRERNRYYLEQCLANSYETYKFNWDRSCRNLGLENDCSLPSDMAERWDKSYKEDNENCFRLYPQD